MLRRFKIYPTEINDLCLHQRFYAKMTEFLKEIDHIPFKKNCVVCIYVSFWIVLEEMWHCYQLQTSYWSQHGYIVYVGGLERYSGHLDVEFSQLCWQRYAHFQKWPVSKLLSSIERSSGFISLLPWMSYNTRHSLLTLDLPNYFPAVFHNWVINILYAVIKRIIG